MKVLLIRMSLMVVALSALAAEKSPIQSSPDSDDSSAPALAAAAKLGASTAAADIEAGRFRILEYGEPRPISKATKDPQTGFSILPVAGCHVTSQIRAEADAYNRVMRDWPGKTEQKSVGKKN